MTFALDLEFIICQNLYLNNLSIVSLLMHKTTCEFGIHINIHISSNYTHTNELVKGSI